jgi:hypothetical protein
LGNQPVKEIKKGRLRKGDQIEGKRRRKKEDGRKEERTIAEDVIHGDVNDSVEEQSQEQSTRVDRHLVLKA